MSDFAIKNLSKGTLIDETTENCRIKFYESGDCRHLWGCLIEEKIPEFAASLCQLRNARQVYSYFAAGRPRILCTSEMRNGTKMDNSIPQQPRLQVLQPDAPWVLNLQEGGSDLMRSLDYSIGERRHMPLGCERERETSKPKQQERGPVS